MKKDDFVDRIVNRIKTVMKPDVTNWNQLSKAEIEEINDLQIQCIDEFNFKKAFARDEITQEQYDIIKQFVQWNINLSG